MFINRLLPDILFIIYLTYILTLIAIYINRQPGQGTTDEIGDRERLKEELRKAEQEYYESKEEEGGAGGNNDGQKLIQDDQDAEARRQKLLEEAERMAALDKDQSDSESDSGGSSSR